MSLPKQLTLDAWGAKFEGEGAELELRFLAMQTTKGRRTHRTVLVLKVNRVEVRKLMEEVAGMQVRDRVRIDGELERLTREIAPLVRT